jgi:hypothetical protein
VVNLAEDLSNLDGRKEDISNGPQAKHAERAHPRKSADYPSTYSLKHCGAPPVETKSKKLPVRSGEASLAALIEKYLKDPSLVQLRSRVQPAFTGLQVGECKDNIQPQKLSNRLSSVDAPRSGPRCEQIEVDEAIKNRKLSTVGNGPETSRRMGHEVRHRHLAAQDQSHGPGEESQDYEQAANELEHAGEPGQGQELSRGAGVSHSAK